MPDAARSVAAWCGRLLLVASGLVLVLVGTDDPSGSRTDLLAIPIGVAFAGGLLMTFRSTARAGAWLPRQGRGPR